MVLIPHEKAGVKKHPLLLYAKIRQRYSERIALRLLKEANIGHGRRNME
jgi:hypothetical protein